MQTVCTGCGMKLRRGVPHLEVVCRVMQAAREMRGSVAATPRGYVAGALAFEQLCQALDDVDAAGEIGADDTDSEWWEMGSRNDDLEAIAGEFDAGSRSRIGTRLDLGDLPRFR